MTNGVKRYRPASELKDHHDLIRIAAGIRASDRRPPGLRKRMLHHITELLKLFAQDPTLGVPDPSREAEERRLVEEKRLQKEQRERSRALEEQVRRSEAEADALGGAPRHGVAATETKLVEDAQAFAANRMTWEDFYAAHPDMSVRAGRVLGSLGPGEGLTFDSLRKLSGLKVARTIEAAFAARGVTIMPRQSMPRAS